MSNGSKNFIIIYTACFIVLMIAAFAVSAGNIIKFGWNTGAVLFSLSLVFDVFLVVTALLSLTRTRLTYCQQCIRLVYKENKYSFLSLFREDEPIICQDCMMCNCPTKHDPEMSPVKRRFNLGVFNA